MRSETDGNELAYSVSVGTTCCRCGVRGGLEVVIHRCLVTKYHRTWRKKSQNCTKTWFTRSIFEPKTCTWSQG
jgi:hypothetical protein